jgi:hypothetical protein
MTECWQQLCALAAIEQDPDKLSALARELNRLLEEREKRLTPKKRLPKGAPSPLT